MSRTPSNGRRSDGPRSLTDYGPVAALARKAAELDALDRALRQTLPQPLRDQVRFANRRGARLIFLAPSSAWAARLRLMQTQILQAARAVGVDAQMVSVKVAPLPPEEKPVDLRKPLSAGAAHHLQAAAQVIADPELKALFLQLAGAAKTEPPSHR